MANRITNSSTMKCATSPLFIIVCYNRIVFVSHNHGTQHIRTTIISLLLSQMLSLIRQPRLFAVVLQSKHLFFLFSFRMFAIQFSHCQWRHRSIEFVRLEICIFEIHRAIINAWEYVQHLQYSFDNLFSVFRLARHICDSNIISCFDSIAYWNAQQNEKKK